MHFTLSIRLNTKQVYMQKEYRILVVGILLMLLLNFFGSIASRAFNFNYSFLFPISFLIYGLVGFFVTRNGNLKLGVLFAAIIGFTESTLGSWVSELLGKPNIGNIQIEMTTGLWIFTIVGVTASAAFIGLIGGLIANKTK